MFESSAIQINETAYRRNLEFLGTLIKENVIFSSVVKGNAYGHGLETFVPMAERCGVKHFSVFSADEAYRVMKSLQVPRPVMIMGMIDDDELAWAIEKGFSFFVFEPGRLREALKMGRKLGKPAKVHLEVETGMNRTGLNSQEMREVIKLFEEYPDVAEFEGLCTHFAGAESIANYLRVREQKKKYKRKLEWFRKRGYQPRYRHQACSAATVRYPETQMDLVRIGILQYGFWPSPEIYIEYCRGKNVDKDPLQRLISWKSQVMDVKNVKTGEYIGYGTSYLATNDMKVASVPVGYAHGFSRSLSNHGRVLIHGERTQVVGMVNMNMMMVDITKIEGVKKGDEVVLIGHQGDAELTVASFAEFSNQVNYELLARLSDSIPRQVVTENINLSQNGISDPEQEKAAT